MWVGFAWADEDRNGAAVMVTGYDEDAILATASELAEAYWAARDDFVIVTEHSGDWDEALDFVMSRPPLLLWIADAGDNVTAGVSGDLTFALGRTLERTDVTESGLAIICEGICNPESVQAAIQVGVVRTADRVPHCCTCQPQVAHQSPPVRIPPIGRRWAPRRRRCARDDGQFPHRRFIDRSHPGRTPDNRHRRGVRRDDLARLADDRRHGDDRGAPRHHRTRQAHCALRFPI